MISIENVTYHYPSSARNVIDAFSLRFAPGRVCGLLGVNGVGKTTLLGLMCGLLRPSAGRVLLGGKDVSKRDPSTMSSLFYVPDEFSLPHISLESYVKVNFPFYQSFSRELLNNCLATFGLPSDIDRLGQLSLGQRKKVLLCFAVASGASVILMDEPTNGLDIPSKSLFRKVIAQAMTDDRLIVISTHQVHDVEQVLDQIVVMDNHEIILNETETDLADKYVFSIVPQSAIPDDAIYFEPTLAGVAIMRPKSPDDPDTQINLELLFNAATKGKLKKS
ncbi:MAG: ATP-binding cassette domain-containing protein [Marinilabiliaceae bacterium]